ncbi:MAG: ABC transporter permease [Rhodocyclaceae bacterium]|jgi:putative ABC transport system permease protein|nr:ABC transporter permease [Rhodocyclaceae bacterium]
MLLRDAAHLALRALTAHRLRSALTLLGISVGIAAVILLTSIGEGVHQFVLKEFSQFGTNVMEVTPGKQGARGGPPGLPGTSRELTLDDALALSRIPGVVAVTPIVWGNSELESNGRLRRTTVYGATVGMLRVFAMEVRVGSFLPEDDTAHPRALVVLGAKLKQELFGGANALGERVRIGGEHFRVVGIMEPKGQFLGTDLDDTAYIPTARAMALYNRSGLISINLSYQENTPAPAISRAIQRLLVTRHGREDFTVTTQEDMLKTLSKILNILTAAVGALGGISLLVGGVGIVTIMLINISERRNEIGLLVALGATPADIHLLFLSEALVLGGLGGLGGLLLGGVLVGFLVVTVGGIPVSLRWEYVVGAEVLSGLLGVLSGAYPAYRGSRLAVVEALRLE